MAVQLRDQFAPVDVPARDRAAVAVGVFVDGEDQAAWVTITRDEALAALHRGPPEIGATITEAHGVDLFDVCLADVCDVHHVAIDREPPRIAEAGRPHRGFAPTIDVWIVGRNAERRIAVCGIGIDAQDRPEVVVRGLAGYPAGGAVAG